MPPNCPRCRRVLAETPAPADPPVFCMYCGARLVADAPAPGSSGSAESTDRTRAYVPSPSADDSAEVFTRSFCPADGERTATHAPIDPDDLLAEGPPPVIGGYRLVRRLGAGGMGAVYEGVRDDSGKRVAVKLLAGRGAAATPHAVERFRQEGRLASQIAHPRCVFVLGADTDAGRPYIVMELMPGTTLKDLVESRGPLPAVEAVARILDVIDGLAEAHRLGVLHRDVKPSNCFLTADDRVKVGDFGLSKSLAVDPDGPTLGHLTGTGAFLGTVLFASPEQIRGEPVGYESDVYAVCGTLYFLLTGRAPYQHTNLTAALANAVTGPPAPVRAARPDVPAALDRVILRGLGLDRTRRYPALADLADALRDQLPATHSPARPRVLTLAYAADALILFVAGLPVGMAADVVRADPLAAEWAFDLVVAGYFAVAEGVYGTTLGKRLLRLRVARVGDAGPPGLVRGCVRAAVFHGVLLVGLVGLGLVITESPVGSSVRLIGAGMVLLSAAGLGVQLYRGRHGYRGLHDRAAGTHALHRPRPAHRAKLAARYPYPLVPEPSKELPARVGGFAVRGRLADLPDGGAVWAAEDPALGRRVVLRVGGPGSGAPPADAAAPRPTRLRMVGHGAFDWDGMDRGWAAYVAPSGAPLSDVVDPARPLPWVDARPLIEQLADELAAAETDGPGLYRPSVDQVWVEPGGRLQVVDFPLPTGRGRALGVPDSPAPGPSDPLVFAREITTLLLEGRPRGAGGPVRAPVPPHAAAVTNKLFRNGPDGYSGLAELRADLRETHAHPPAVTAPMRAAHLGVQGAMLAAGVAVLFAAAGLYTLGVGLIAAGPVWAAEKARAAVADPGHREIVRTAARTVPDDFVRTQLDLALAPDRAADTLARLDAHITDRRAATAKVLRTLSAPERRLLARIGEVVSAHEPGETSEEHLRTVAVAVAMARSPAAGPPADPRRELWFVAVGLVCGVPLVWAGFAFAFRGGLAMRLAGISILTADGRPAGRLRCAARELVVWLPVVALLLACLWVQATAPRLVGLRAGLWLTAVGLLPLWALIALRCPSRPPQDRLMRTFLVPD